MERTTEAIAGMAEEATQDGAAAILAVGTAGLRIAPNSADFIATVRARCGLTVEVISGDEEADLPISGRRAGLGGPPGPGGLRHRRRQLAVHVRSRTTRSTRGSASTWALCATQSGTASVTRSPRTCWPRLSAPSLPTSIVSRSRPTPEVARRHGRGCHESRRRQARPRQYDADIVQGTVLDRAEIDRQIELYRRRTPRTGGRSSAAAPAGRHHTRGSVHRPDGAREARAGLAHRERSRTTARALVERFGRRAIPSVGSPPVSS